MKNLFIFKQIEIQETKIIISEHKKTQSENKTKTQNITQN